MTWTGKIINQAKQAGLSLVELMVAILIGLIILAGVLQVMITSKSTFLGQEEVSFIQENARYAMDVIGKDIRKAGYFGCAGFNKNVAFVPNIDANSEESTIFGIEPVFSMVPDNFSDDIRPVVEGDNATRPFPLITRSVGEYPAALTQDQVGTVLNVASVDKIKLDELIAVIGEDCRAVAVLKATAINGTAIDYADGVCNTVNTIKLAPNENLICDANCNCNGTAGAQANISRYFKQGAVVSKFETNGYYIANSTVLPDQPALRRRIYQGADDGVGRVVDEEIALGVEDMQIFYGIGNGGAIEYLPAEDMVGTDNWNNVVAVEVNLVFRSQSEVLDTAQAQTILGTDFNDRYMRRLISSTFYVRNRG